jgi:thymidylate synthase (FAD)
MKVELIAITPNCLEVIETACRTCYDSAVNAETREKFIASVIKRGHHSVVEHACATFKIEGVSRALLAQLTRHRIASYSVRSQRYCKEIQFDYVIPPEITANEVTNRMYRGFMESAQATYLALMKFGIKAEDARFVLPNACCTEITTTMNFRALRNFFELRCDKHAQWEIRELANKMLDIMMQHAACVFSDLKETL